MKFEFSTNATFDHFFEQLFEFLKTNHGASQMNAFAECSQLSSGSFSSHYKFGNDLKLHSTVSQDEFNILKEQFKCFSIGFRILSSDKLRFHIFHDGNSFKPKKLQRKMLRRLVEKTARYKIRTIRDRIISASFEEERLEEFFNIVISKCLPDFIKAEKASIFYAEEAFTNLVLGASNGIRHRSSTAEISRTDVVYNEDSNSKTYECFKTKSPFFEISPMRNCRFIENVHKIENRLYMPIKARPEFAGFSDIIPNSNNGVLRLVNFKRNGEYQSYSDVDYVILCYICEYLAVLTNQYSNVMLLTREHDRATHGYNTDLLALGLLSDGKKIRINNLFDKLFVNLRTIPVTSASSAEKIIETQNSAKKLETQVQYLLKNMVAIHDSMSAQFLTAMLFSDNSAGFIAETTSSITFKPMVAGIHRIRNVFSHITETHGVSGLKLMFADNLHFEDNFTRIPAIHFPPEYFYLILRNLVENSIKYSKRHSRVGIVNLRWIATNEEVMITIQDNGIGIPHGEAEKIFKTGYRADNAIHRTPKGMGLGLSNCRHIVELHGGTLSYDGVGIDGEGAQFSIRLRRA